MAIKLVHIQVPTQKALFYLILTDFNLLHIATHAKFVGPRHETITQKHVLGRLLPATNRKEVSWQLLKAKKIRSL